MKGWRKPWRGGPRQRHRAADPRIRPVPARLFRMTLSSQRPAKITRFSPSGRVHPLTLPAVLALAVPAALLAWPYQWIVELLAAHGGKAIVVATFFVPALGGLTGWLAWTAVQRGKCRNPGIGALAGWLLALVALAASYYVSYRHAGGEYTAGSVSEYLEAATTSGWRIVGPGPDIYGAMVYVVWGLEGAIVLGVSGWLGRGQPGSRSASAAGSGRTASWGRRRSEARAR
jgi:hypothetical protein